jgi:hypothetical protein
MMTDLRGDWGGDFDRNMALARQGAEALVQASGLGKDALDLFTAAIAPKVGDAAVMRMMAEVGKLISDDSAPGLGKGGGLAMSAADAKAQLASFTAPGSPYAQAVQAGNRAEIARLKPEFERLARIAAGSG